MSANGTWNVTVQTPMGAQSGTISVTIEGSAFSGAFTSPMMGTLPVENGQIDGDQLTWTMAMTSPMPMKLDGEATVSGDTMTGKVKAGVFGSMALSGTRA
ncbi:hypothetical protein H7F50_12945 [Novosphingobium flavum]|uniref:Uncharacterized protein n=1 Tax=Novosphingobium aerophilum TaxID=2839843 RepID=A0A7X1F890_9SPHN|nr:hypothetical protein [Novosphingobium aerophilum]MBC2652227.1 hypothetical protein [Novosphingobium aerophilum]MBC2662660.1 hypothetical protein [Novosphingobium aerophilum]